MAQVFSSQEIGKILDKPSKGSMRDAYGEALVKLGAELKDIVVVEENSILELFTGIAMP